MGAPAIKRTAGLLCNGTSLTKGYLSGFWAEKLVAAMDARGLIRPVRMTNVGKGSQTSAYLVSQLADTISHRPTHILTELNTINDAAPGLFSGGLVGHTNNSRTYIEGLLAALPDVDITIQTMSPGPGRPDLAAMYQIDRDLAAEYDLRLLDNYPRYPVPLTAGMTVGGDQLHLTEATSDEYLLPYVATFLTPILNAWNGGL